MTCHGRISGRDTLIGGWPGTVSLVGAGPGDVGLLTLRGAERLSQAQVVVYDRLVAAEVLSLAAPAARRTYVGKSAGHHAMSQDEINELLVREARAGRRVVRLKGGDPFVFGRGGEEALALQRAGVPFEVVPGITAGVAGPAYAGIPVTHRELSSAVVLVTGHEDPGKPESDLDYGALARIATVVFYMGVARLPDVVSGLTGAGRSPETPAALIQRATTSRQRTLVATLGTLAARAEAESVTPPAVVVVGDTVGLREHLAWYEQQPLADMTVVVTRTREQASDLSAGVRDLGAHVIELPTIAVELMGDAILAAALDRVGEYDWLVFTSPNGVDRFFACLRDTGADARRLAGLRVAVIGPGSAHRLSQHGVRADLVPPLAIAESLAEALLEAGVGKETRILLPRAEGARAALPDALRREGATVDDLAVYRAVVPTSVDRGALEVLAAGEADLVTLTSSSTAEHFAALVESELGDDALARIRASTSFAAIGPITAGTARDLGFRVAVEAGEHTITGLVEAIRRWAEATPDTL